MPQAAEPYGANGTRSRYRRAAALSRQLVACPAVLGWSCCKATNSENTAVKRVGRCNARPASQQQSRLGILKSGQLYKDSNMEQQANQPRGECMTAEEWRKTHRDFKATIRGQRYVLRWTDKGTGLVPVTIIKEQGR